RLLGEVVAVGVDQRADHRVLPAGWYVDRDRAALEPRHVATEAGRRGQRVLDAQALLLQFEHGSRQVAGLVRRGGRILGLHAGAEQHGQAKGETFHPELLKTGAGRPCSAVRPWAAWTARRAAAG